MQILNRCKHPSTIKRGRGFDFRLARLAVRLKIPGAYHYVISSFFFPPVRKKFTTLVPPIFRPEVITAKREPGEHVLVYLRTLGDEALVSTLKTLPYRFRVYGTAEHGTDGNVTLLPFSGTGFLEDLRTPRAVLAGGGFSLMSEAVSLRVPIFSVPIERQYEQELNARYLRHLGYGTWAARLSADALEEFLKRTNEYTEALASYEREDNSILFDCVDELLARAADGKKRPKRLNTRAMGKWTENP